MESLIVYLTDESTLLYQWQDLLGSVIGVLGAFTVALLGFLANHFYQSFRERRESIRQTEISLALGLNDLYDAERHLSDFLDRLDRSVIQPLQSNANSGQYFLNRTNFPPLSIHVDSSLLKARHRSYYVHNKVLIIHKNIEQANKMYLDMKIEYERIFEMAKFLINRGASIENQRTEYLINNQNFKNFITETINQLQIAKKVFAQTKAYNLKLLNKQRFSVWRLEGTSFKFFCCKKDIEEYKSTLRCLDRIDGAIEHEVTMLMKEAEERRDGLNQNLFRRSFVECVKKSIFWLRNYK
ncbi:hypothetical protein KKC83_02610 [Patescibacteria group bacterium]|nr:hypothetical protein [Candidatus Falkowbacteria bacterium]MBU3905862.1 hypothetical protein [Patescibacteria group bacterium]MBU4015467.1 hypothetical protein [Patescibacteria group bacterium]MBU4026409.1 hypothetical protein [Patescibacteria group bacterium]MBU4072682.1 hypothetical protein [Patescibacteria group bacterium]